MPADYSVPLSELAMLLSMLSRTSASEEEAFPVPLEMQLEDEIAHGAESDAEVTSLLGEPFDLQLPRVRGRPVAPGQKDLRRFRCQVGHTYSAVHLFHAQEAALQGQLWAAVRALREHALLARQSIRRRRGTAGPRSRNASSRRRCSRTRAPPL